jgi:hypothetical protein
MRIALQGRFHSVELEIAVVYVPAAITARGRAQRTNALESVQQDIIAHLELPH